MRPRRARAEGEDRSNARLADGRWFRVARYEKGEEEAEEERQEKRVRCATRVQGNTRTTVAARRATH